MSRARLPEDSRHAYEARMHRVLEEIDRNFDQPLMSDGRTREGQIATDVVPSVFRANGLLLNRDERLAGPEGLTSARRQVVGALKLALRLLIVSQIARLMGRAQQSVHATFEHLIAHGLVKLASNAHHARSQLVCLTRAEDAKDAAIDRRHAA